MQVQHDLHIVQIASRSLMTEPPYRKDSNLAIVIQTHLRNQTWNREDTLSKTYSLASSLKLSVHEWFDSLVIRKIDIRQQLGGRWAPLGHGKICSASLLPTNK